MSSQKAILTPIKDKKYAGVILKNEKGRKKKWKAYTKIKGRQTHIGYYKTKEEAYIAKKEFKEINKKQ